MPPLPRTLFCCLCLIFTPSSLALYEAKISQASQWLASQQNADGSWGNTDSEKFISTAEAVNALWASGRRTEAYYRGITWLENHAADNLDYLSRRAVSLSVHGNSVAEPLLAGLETEPSNPTAGGWGLGDQYLAAPIDTALALSGVQALDRSQQAVAPDMQPALDYLKAAQLPGTGWSLAASDTSDALSTALVIKSLAPWQIEDPSLAAPIANGISHLQNSLTTASPMYLQALAAQAALEAGDDNSAHIWLTQLTNNQAPDGSWSTGRIYDTALALSALAVADGLDGDANQAALSIPDANLRAAINAALGRGALDQLSCGELAQLTSLVANNRSITDLTGLECATNLSYLDVRDNNIASTAAIDGLSQLTTLLIAGNPVAGGDFEYDEDIPTLPEWGMILMAALLAWQLVKLQRQHNRRLSQSQDASCAA